MGFPGTSVYKLIREPGFTCLPLEFVNVVKDSGGGFSASEPDAVHVVLDCQPGHWPKCHLQCSCSLEPVLPLQQLEGCLDVFKLTVTSSVGPYQLD